MSPTEPAAMLKPELQNDSATSQVTLPGVPGGQHGPPATRWDDTVGGYISGDVDTHTMKDIEHH